MGQRAFLLRAIYQSTMSPFLGSEPQSPRSGLSGDPLAPFSPMPSSSSHGASFEAAMTVNKKGVTANQFNAEFGFEHCLKHEMEVRTVPGARAVPKP